jgi:hypothetical protein
MRYVLGFTNPILVPEGLVHRQNDSVVTHDQHARGILRRSAEYVAVLLNPEVGPPHTECGVDLRNIEDDFLLSGDLSHP